MNGHAILHGIVGSGGSEIGSTSETGSTSEAGSSADTGSSSIDCRVFLKSPLGKFMLTFTSSIDSLS